MSIARAAKYARPGLGLAILLLALFAYPDWIAAETSGPDEFEPFFFVVMADPQLGWATRDANTDIEEENFLKAIEAANRLHPAFVLICGDLVNAPGDPDQIETFKRLMEAFDETFPVYLVSGNHDVTGAPTPASLETYRKEFGPDRYTFDYSTSRFIVLNSTLLVNGKKVEEEAERQFAWVRKELERARTDGVKDIFIAQHHPWFLESPTEPRQLFNNVPPEARKPYLELFETYNVMASFAGHLHRNRVATHGNLEMIVTSSITPPFGDEAAGFRIVKVYGDAIEHAYHELESVPDSVELGVAASTGSR